MNETMPLQDDDKTLVKRFVEEKDEFAYEVLVKKYQRMVYFLALKVVGGHEDADEIVQKTFISVYKNLGRFEGRSSLKTWIFRIAMNYSKNLIRDRARHAGEELADWNATVESSVEADIEADQRRRIVEEAMEQLPPRQREVLQMRAFGDMSFAEIAQDVGISTSAAKVNYHYAVKALKGLLADFGESHA
ncbi:MAG TPA: sigma-70 family RNA polymerase sigma factor [bacterium]|nr:sigma-70 family RNA polymerase sigma factor [bacterium]